MINRRIGLFIIKSSEINKAELPSSRQPGYLPPIKRPVVFRRRLTAGLAFYWDFMISIILN
jgi:hypothetical protein